MHKWDPEGYQKSSSAQFGWAMNLISGLKLNGRERILDIGCGDGRITAHLADLVSEGRVLGVDLSAEMIGYAAAGNAMHPNLRFLVADASRLDFSNEFDLVVSFACLHWIRDHLPVLHGVKDCLVPGGHFLMQCGGRGNAAGLLNVTEEMIAGSPWQKYFEGFCFPYNFYGPDEYRRWLLQAGLRPGRVELMPKDMVHQGRAGLEGIIRTTWLPYTERLPHDLQNSFVKEVAARYLEKCPLDECGQAHVQMIRLEVEADRMD
jgi:trans-aconitate methyltransferase